MLGGAGTQVFLLGLASGLALLAISAYRRVSPAWLKWLLMTSGVLLISRYVLTTRWMNAGEAAQLFLYCCWAVSSIAFTLPGFFAIDQLIRHPAMTPKKLLRWYALFLIVDGMALALVRFQLVLVHTLFLIGFAGVCLLLRRKIPSAPIQRALLGLALSYGYLGLDVLMAALGRWGLTPILYSEMAALPTLWYAYDMSIRLQREPTSL